MLVTVTYRNAKRVQYVCIRFCCVWTDANRHARMAAFERICGLFERGLMMERGKDSLRVNGGLNGTGRGLRSVSACIIVRGMIDPSPASRTICKYGTSGTKAGKVAGRTTIANVICVTYCVSDSTRVITFVMILFTLINEILYCYSNNNTDICTVPNKGKRFFEIMKCA